MGGRPGRPTSSKAAATSPRGAASSATQKPAFTLNKLQRDNGNPENPFTTATFAGAIGENIEYEVIAKNTGNVPLTFSNFTDPKCDEGTITGGPGANPVPVGGSTTYFCVHNIKAEDSEAGVLENTAELAGELVGGGTPTTHVSNTVVVAPISP